MVQLFCWPARHRRNKAFIGRQSGGRVFLFLRTVDFWRDFHAMRSAVNFVREPKEAGYGTVAVFEDLYGNLWDLLLDRIEHFAKPRLVSVGHTQWYPPEGRDAHSCSR